MQTFDDKIKLKESVLSPREFKRGESVSELPEQLVCGRVDIINSNEKLKAHLIDSLFALAALPIDDVIFFDETPQGRALMDIFFSNADLIGVEPVVLKGYPGVAASTEFEQCAWNLPTVSYIDLVSEITSVSRIDRMRKDEAGERQKPAKKEDLLTKDRVKHFADFEQVTGGDEDDSNA